jgi:hypothetical protein
VQSSYQKIRKLIHICKLVPDVSPDTLEKFISGTSALLLDVKATVYDFITADAEAKQLLTDKLYRLACVLLIYPAVIYSFYDAFKVRYGKRGVESVINYAGSIPMLSDSEQYRALITYTELTGHAAAENATGVFACIAALSEDQRLRSDIADHIRMCSLNRNTQSAKTALIYELCIHYLKSGKPRFDIVYDQYRSLVEDEMISDDTSDIPPEKQDKAVASKAIDMMLDIATEICFADDDYINMICDDASGFPDAIKSFILEYGLGVTKFFKERLESVPYMMRSMIDRMVKEYRPKGTDVINMIIGKR